MARYIDADALESKKFISWTCPEFFDEGAREQQAYQIGWNNAIEAVMENEPTADVRPNVGGKWRHTNRTGWTCECCGHVITHLPKITYNFCPNCGADMRGNEND